MINSPCCFCSTDSSIAKNAITPLAERQHLCMLWLENHFDKYGDKSPNKDETHLLAMTKEEVYKKYQLESSKINEHCDMGGPVQYDTFTKIWAVVFPHCFSRPWCNIPGKCDSCYEIDRKRREPNLSAKEEKYLKIAHSLHRGGLFMPERNE